MLQIPAGVHNIPIGVSYITTVITLTTIVMLKIPDGVHNITIRVS